MANKYLNGNLFKTLVANGCQSLINDIDRINDLNVFINSIKLESIFCSIKNSSLRFSRFE